MNSISNSSGPVPVQSEVDLEEARLQSQVDQSLAVLSQAMESGNYGLFSLALIDSKEKLNRQISFLISTRHQKNVANDEKIQDLSRRASVLKPITQAQIDSRENAHKGNKARES